MMHFGNAQNTLLAVPKGKSPRSALSDVAKR